MAEKRHTDAKELERYENLKRLLHVDEDTQEYLETANIKVTLQQIRDTLNMGYKLGTYAANEGER